MFILRRLALSIFVIFGVLLITFVITRVVPSDPTAKWVGPKATLEQREAARKELGLDQPIPVQFVRYLNGVLHGDLGVSLYTRVPISQELKTLLPATIELVILSSVFAFLIGLPLGVLSAAEKDKALDHVSRFFSVGTVSIPSFAVALFLQLVFYRWLGILPIGGRLSRELQLFGEIPKITDLLLIDTLLTGNFSIFKDAIIHLIMPVIALAAGNIGFTARLTRSAMLEILSEDFIKAAKSYGLGQRIVLWSYALKNSLGPTATVMTMMVGYSLTNTFLVETIFSWPGIGNYVALSIITLNYPAILGVTLISALAFVSLNLLADLIILLDPRARK